MGKLLKATEAAEYLGVTSQTIMNFIERGILHKATISNNRQIYLYAEELELLSKRADSEIKSIEQLKQDIREFSLELESKKYNYKKQIESYTADVESADEYKTYVNGCLTMFHKIAFSQFVKYRNKREYEIMEAYFSGATRSEIAKKHDLSTQRIKDLLEMSFRKICHSWKESEYLIKELKERDKEIEKVKSERDSYKSKYEAVQRYEKVKAIEINLLDNKVDSYPLSIRAKNCLHAADIITLRDLVKMNRRDLLLFRNFGKVTLNELDKFLNELGLHFGMIVDRVETAYIP